MTVQSDPSASPAPPPDPVDTSAAAAPPPAAAPAPAANESWARPDWRESYAKQRGGDDKLVNRLSRYASPDAALDALVSMQTKLSAGELRVSTPFPVNGTDDQKAEWRRGNGIPDKPENYKIDLGGGLVVGEEDKPVVDSFLKAAHASNLPASQVNSLLKWYFTDLVEGETAKRHELDQRVAQEVDDKLHVEWGQEYRKNKVLIEAYIDGSGPPGLKDMLFSARLADGTPLASNLEVLRWLADRAREFNPTLALVPGDPSMAGKTIGDEMANLQAQMANKNSEYWKGPKAQQLQERYRKLLEARDRLP
jgi:hypothetical protein